MSLCYKDRTFCDAADRCKNAIGCYRHLDKIERTKAGIWAKACGMTDGPIIAWADFSGTCLSYEVKC